MRNSGKWSRRDLLAFGLSTVGSAAAAEGLGTEWLEIKPSSPASPAAPLQPVVRTLELGVPDFELLHETRPFVAGLRPYRSGGMRLEIAKPIETSEGMRHVVHNYGHGGAGITLSFGAAERAAELVQQSTVKHFQGTPPAIAIIGSGVIGLTTARAIKERWPIADVTVFASTCDPKNTTSFKAGGMFAPASTLGEYYGNAADTLLNATLDRSSIVLGRLSAKGAAARLGIDRRPAYSFQTDGGNVRLKMGRAVHRANAYETWMINPTVLLPALRQDLEKSGVQFITRHFVTRADIYDLAQSVIVNCTGLGAAALFDDKLMEARRGHLVVLRNPKKLRYLLTSWCGASTRYMFSRGDDIVIGGTIRHGEEATEFNPSDESDVRAVERIRRSARSLFEGSDIKCA